MTIQPNAETRKRLLWLTILASTAVLAMPAHAAVERFKFTSGANYLVVEFLDDDLVHFEISGNGPGPGTNTPISTTPQVAKTDYQGPTSVTQSGSGGTTMETPEISVAVHPASLCVAVTDKVRGVALTTACPLNLVSDWKGLTIQPGTMQHVYGLGEQFVKEGEANGDWSGRTRSPGDQFGNQMVGFSGGAVGNLQIPVMYAVGPTNANYALFLDHIYKQQWDFAGSPWKVETWGDPIRWYAMTGSNLQDLRKDYMELTGHPPVPPKKIFGMWISEYGYDNWGELEGKLSALRADQFPRRWFCAGSPVVSAASRRTRTTATWAS